MTETDALEGRCGYDAKFTGTRIPLPTLVDAEDALQLNGSPVIPYTRFSLTLSLSTKLARWVAWNIDGTSLPADTGADSPGRDGLSFRRDPRIDPGHQTLDALYDANRLDKGHIARRADLLWGEPSQAVLGNYDSFFYTNITPQMDKFNQSRLKGVWGCLENAVMDQARTDDVRVTVMAGPIVEEANRLYREVHIPVEFWKILAYRKNGRLRARAFVVKQDLTGLRARPLSDPFNMYERSITRIGAQAKLVFPSCLLTAQKQGKPQGRREIVHEVPIEGLGQITW